MTCPQPSEPNEQYELVVAGPASRAIANTLPESAAWAVTDFITGRLLGNPQRIGYPLENELTGLHGAHVGDYRVVYRIDEEQRTVEVLRVAHRADVYRRR